MTDPISLALTALAASLGFAIIWVQWPQTPELDGERWFKSLLVALLQGHVEGRGGDADAFDTEVIRFVPYHPAGRFPERKITMPELAVTGAALDGERALCETLAALPTREARWARLYDEDEAGLDARLSDPYDLGEVYDPTTAMGPDASWEAVAAWGKDPDSEAAVALKAALWRSLPVRWVLIKGRSSHPSPAPVLDALAQILGERAVMLKGDAGAEGVAEALGELADDDGPPLVHVGEEAGVTWLLHALPDNVVLRERTQAILSVGGVIGGRSDVDSGPLSTMAQRDWLGAHFRQRQIETDVVRLTPYFAVQWLDRTCEEPGIEGLSLASMRFPDPDPTDASAITVETVDLGPLPAIPTLPTELVARALITFITAWLAQRR
ncbi:MAG: hypothetical protein AAGA48_07300 [Myxococcota bacterium]